MIQVDMHGGQAEIVVLVLYGHQPRSQITFVMAVDLVTYLPLLPE